MSKNNIKKNKKAEASLFFVVFLHLHFMYLHFNNIKRNKKYVYVFFSFLTFTFYI